VQTLPFLVLHKGKVWTIRLNVLANNFSTFLWKLYMTLWLTVVKLRCVKLCAVFLEHPAVIITTTTTVRRRRTTTTRKWKKETVQTYDHGSDVARKLGYWVGIGSWRRRDVLLTARKTRRCSMPRRQHVAALSFQTSNPTPIQLVSA